MTLHFVWGHLSRKQTVLDHWFSSVKVLWRKYTPLKAWRSDHPELNFHSAHLFVCRSRRLLVVRPRVPVPAIPPNPSQSQMGVQKETNHDVEKKEATHWPTGICYYNRQEQKEISLQGIPSSNSVWAWYLMNCQPSEPTLEILAF